MRKILAGHGCFTAQQMGWGGVKNGELLRLADQDFDLFVTSDQNLRYQQNLSGRRLAILELSTNKLRRIEAARDLIEVTIGEIQPGQFVHLVIP